MKQKLITITLTIMAVLAPLLIMPSEDYYNVPKLIIMLAVGLVLLILLLASYKSLTLDKKDTIILIFLGLAVISTLVANRMDICLIGTKNRYEGLLMFITYICIYMCAKKYFKYEKMSTFLNIMFYTAMVIGVLGIAQAYVSCKALYPIFNKGICATFGNSNFFGSYISIVLPISSAIFIFKGNKKSFILSLVMFFNMISSGTRSAWVAFGVAGLCGFIYLIKQKDKKYFKRAFILLIAFVLIFMYLYNGFGIFKRNSTTVLKMTQMKNDIEKAVNTGLSDEMGSSRIIIWRMSLKLIQKRPILGCGPDNLWYGLVKNCYEDAYEFALKRQAGIDKVHNEYLQIAATLGIPALVYYLAFIVLILLPKLKTNNNTEFIICLTIISYLAQAFFNISTIGIAPLFWMILGLADNKDFINKEL